MLWKTLGADDMWHAIMQIIKVNMTHFLSYKRQFLSHSPNPLRHFHCITSGVCVSKDLLCRADGMTTVSLHRFGNLEKKKEEEGINKQKKALQDTRYGSRVQVSKRFDTCENIKALTAQLTLTHTEH